MNKFDLCKKACFTGYRPQKFSFSLNSNNANFNLLKSRIIKTVTALIEDECTVFYTGMAQGFDILCAECVLDLKNDFPQISLIACLPHKNQELSFTDEWRVRYYDVLSKCDSTVCMFDEYCQWCFQERNKYMVDSSDFVICWYDGKHGGTRNTIKYAQKNQKFIINLNLDYSENLNPVQTFINL